jgi:hypothetical protein
MRGETLFVVGWVSGKGAREQPVWDEHAAFMDRLFERGRARVEDEGEARRLLEPDPWCSNGRDIQGIGRIRPWTIFLDSHDGV